MMLKNHLYRFLMLFSVCLLIIFQVYWLKKVYLEQKELLNKEIDNIFVQDIRDMQDSIFRLRLMDVGGQLASERRSRAAILAIGLDSLVYNKQTPSQVQILRVGAEINQRIFIRLDSSRGRHEHAESGFTNGRSSEMENRLKRRERFYHNALAAVRENARDSSNRSAGFFAMFSDTLPLAGLRARVEDDMQRAGFAMPIEIFRAEKVPDFSGFPGMMTFYSAGMPPVHLYVAKISGFRPFLFRQMVPSLLFAFLLIGVTSLSFVVIFRSLQEQRQLAKLKNDFISNITHELKTPISTLSVALEALQNFRVLENPEKTREYLTISQHELQRLSILVDRVLKMSLFEQKGMQLQTERFDVRSTLQKIIQSMGLQFEKARAEVQLQVEGENFLVEGDPVHLTNVFYNLLDNALKYSPSNPDIRIGLKEVNGRVQISVQDKGIGIEKEFQDKIFEQFFRAPQSGSQHNTKGYGLGLSYVSEVVRCHHGDITVNSTPGKGSTFTVSLPKTREAFSS